MNVKRCMTCAEVPRTLCQVRTVSQEELRGEFDSRLTTVADSGSGALASWWRSRDRENRRFARARRCF